MKHFDWRSGGGHFTLGFGFSFSRTMPSRLASA
jgi:hypothetical protein